MKKILILSVAVAAMLFTACGPKEEEIVNSSALQGIKLAPSSVTLEEGESVKLHVKYTPDSAKATAPKVLWYSDKQRVASVNEEGLVTADRVGTAVITATCGKFEAKCTVEVTKLELPQPEPDPEINFSLSTELINAPAKGGTYDITITTDTTWKAACEKSWAHLSQTEGKGNATIQVTVDPADSESTLTQKITFFVGKGKYFVTIQRKGNKFSVSPELIEAPAKGGTFTITVTSDVAWTAACEQSWAKLDKTSGDGDATVKVTVNPDDTYSASSQKIVFTAGGNSYYVTIKRAAKVKMTIDKTEINVPVTGGTYTVNVNAGNEQWEAKEKTPSGIVTITKSGNKATIVVGKNIRAEGRVICSKEKAGSRYSLPIVFSAGDQKATLTLQVEEPYAYYDNVTNATYDAEWKYIIEHGNTQDKVVNFSISVKSNIPWKVITTYDNAYGNSYGTNVYDFVTVSPTSGSGNGTVAVKATIPYAYKTAGVADMDIRGAGEWDGIASYTFGGSAMGRFEVAFYY